jgi:hypothetical protein
MYLSLLLKVLLLLLGIRLLLAFLRCHTTATMIVIMMHITEQILTIIISVVKENCPMLLSSLYRTSTFTSGSFVGGPAEI